MYLWRSLCTLYLHACQVRFTVGNSGLCCCVSVWCLLSANSLVCWFYMSALGFVLFQTVKQKLWQTGARAVSVTMAYLRCLSRTDHAPQSVVQLAGPSQLAVTTNRRVQSTQVGQRGSECQSVQHLTQQTDDFGKKQQQPLPQQTINQQMKLCVYSHKKSSKLLPTSLWHILFYNVSKKYMYYKLEIQSCF